MRRITKVGWLEPPRDVMDLDEPTTKADDPVPQKKEPDPAMEQADEEEEGDDAALTNKVIHMRTVSRKKRVSHSPDLVCGGVARATRQIACKNTGIGSGFA